VSDEKFSLAKGSHMRNRIDVHSPAKHIITRHKYTITPEKIKKKKKLLIFSLPYSAFMCERERIEKLSLEFQINNNNNYYDEVESKFM
jgi:hypothetical protein